MTVRSRFLSVAVLLCAVAATAITTPLLASDFEAGMRYAVVPPRTNDFAGSSLDIGSSGGFAATAEFFRSEQLSLHFAATFVNPAVILYPAVSPPSDVDLTTLGLDTYSLSGRWYFMRDSRIRPYAGAGLGYVVIGDLNDRFGDAIEVVFDPKWEPVAEGGVRYQILPRLALDLSVSWMPLSAESKVVRNDDLRVELPAQIELDPLTFSAGAAWRF